MTSKGPISQRTTNSVVPTALDAPTKMGLEHCPMMRFFCARVKRDHLLIQSMDNFKRISAIERE